MCESAEPAPHPNPPTAPAFHPLSNRISLSGGGGVVVPRKPHLFKLM